MQTTSPTVEFPEKEDLDYYECEQGSGSGHKIVSIEFVTRVHYDIDPDTGRAENIDQEVDALWWDCSCGHQTKAD